MKKFITKLLKNAGFYYFKRNYLPFGVNLYVDLKRFDPDLIMGVIFDVGANEGQTYIEFRDAYPAAHIYSFEPCAQTYSKLCTTMTHDALAHPLKMALGAGRGTACLIEAPDSRLNKIQSVAQDNSDSEVVPIEPLDTFCVEKSIHFIDLLKTDTEGYDLEVLKGAQGLLAKKKIRFIYSEVTFDKSNTQCSYFPPISDYLSSFGYSFLGIYHPYFQSNPKRIQYCNALFIS